MTALKDDPRLTAFALGELDSEQADEVRRELALQPELAGEVEAIASMGIALRSELEREACGGLSADECEALLGGTREPAGGLRAGKRGARGWWHGWRLAGWGLAGATAALALLFSVVSRQPREVEFGRVAEPSPAVVPGVPSPAAQDPRPPVGEPEPAVAASVGAAAVDAGGDAAAGTIAEVATSAIAQPEAVAPADESGTAGPVEAVAVAAQAAGSDASSVLDLALPLPAFMGTPTDVPVNEHLERPSDKPRPPFLVPRGTRLLSLNAAVVSSDRNPINGGLELVTDGNKEAGDSNVLELHRRLQWVQVDLGRPARMYAVVIWHAHDTPQIVHDVVVQVADDADFTANVRTLYNNDYDNSAGLGVGGDKEYFETYEGRLIDARGTAGRFVRCYSQGSTYTALNRFTEVEIHGIPLDDSAP